MSFSDEKNQTCTYIGTGSVPCERASVMAVRYLERTEVEYPCLYHYEQIPKQLIEWEEKL